MMLIIMYDVAVYVLFYQLPTTCLNNKQAFNPATPPTAKLLWLIIGGGHYHYRLLFIDPPNRRSNQHNSNPLFVGTKKGTNNLIIRPYLAAALKHGSREGDVRV